jgi:Na+/H+ antiporter NhaD/arsenite permease-like protein
MSTYFKLQYFKNMKKLIFFFLFMFLALNYAEAAKNIEAKAKTHTEHSIDEIHTSGHDAEMEHGHLHIDGKDLSLWWAIPFIGILLSIAIFPLVNHHFWEHHYGKVSMFWGVVFLLGFLLYFGGSITLFYILEVFFLEFLPFITLLLALFTVSGGIRLKGELIGSPKVNLTILIIGTVLASWMGTTGAAMLLIRPLIRANSWRKSNKHVVIFFIFLVANIGGSLTPLGDPPLFLGFLQGVSFFWPTTHMFIPMVFVSVILLITFYVMDNMLYKKETDKPVKQKNGEKLGLDGKRNIILLPFVVLAALSSSLDIGEVALYHVHIRFGSIIQIAMFLAITFISIYITRKETRELNLFTWEPIREVAKLFATIFITMVPMIAILKAGEDGALSNLIGLVSANGENVNSMYFWLTGILSSFLDNAPTYMIFFNTAGGNAEALMTTLAPTLLAISCGAVFMGANTYIGNAPNFMVKSIAEENKIKMPSFFGYMVWSFCILIPVFLLVTWVFF